MNRIRYDGMYVLFPEDEEDYYYFLRFFEDDQATGRMISSNYTFQEIYRMVYNELESQKNFEMIQFGKNIFLESNLIFDLKGTIEENALKLTGTMKDGRNWRGGKQYIYQFIPYNMIYDPGLVWSVAKSKSPLSVLADGIILENQSFPVEMIQDWSQISKKYRFLIEEENEKYHLDIQKEDLVVKNEELIGFYFENHLFYRDETGISKENDGKIIRLEKYKLEENK